MHNPWLDIPLTDYEAHMALPTVGQSGLIADHLETLIRIYAPRSVAILGCAGGNGFNRLISIGIRRVVGVDINPEYIAQAPRRYKDLIPGLELHVSDIQSCGSIFDPVDLIYVALVLEYVDLYETMGSLRRHCKPGGILAVLTQLPHEEIAHISPSPYTSLQILARRMRLVPSDELRRLASNNGLSLKSSRVLTSAGNKQFRIDEFVLSCGAGKGERAG